MTATPAAPRTMKISLKAFSEFAVPAAVLGIVIALIAPMPSFLLDLLIVCDIMMSVVVLMVAMYITKPVEFNVFPTTLLLLTLFRLVAERFFGALDFAERALRNIGCGGRDSGLRKFCGGRQLHCRRGDLSGA